MNDTPAGKWTHLVQLANASQHPLQLLIGSSADAACASRSLVRLLRNNRVRFEAMPVTTAEQMQAVATANLDASMEEDPRHVYLLVGCGAAVDLTAVFDMNRLGAIFVLDAQRPLHLANMRSDRVLVWNESAAAVGINRFFAHHNRKTLASRRRRGRTTSRKHAAPERRAKAHRHDGDDFSDATSDTDASESDAWHSDSASSADPENPNDDAASSADEGDAEDLDLGDGTTIDWRNEAVPGELERLYYSAAWHEQPAAITVHELSVAVGQQHEAILWGASVGLADTLKRRGISTTAYEVELDKLAESVSQMAATRRTLIGNALTDVTTNENGEQRAGACAWRLKLAYDPALFCLSHTSLQAALELDPVLAARLRVHRHADRNNNVSELFAHVGVSLQTAQRNWAELSSESRADTLRRLGEELVRLGFAEASLQLTRRVVSRVVGFGVEVSPFDACTLFYAEASRPRKASVAQAGGTEALVEHYRRQFWEACKVIDAAPHTKEFGEALDEALHVSEVATQVTAEVMQPGGVVATQLVHYTMLGERGGGQAVRALAHPARMALLAEHVMEALAVESKRHQRRRPLIVGAPCANPALSGDNECVVVCSTPHFESATHVEPVVGEFQGALSDLEDPVPTSFLEPMVAGVTGRDAALGFLEAVHLRLAR